MEYLSFLSYEAIFATFVTLWLSMIMVLSIRKVKLRELFTSEGTNKISHTKFWANIAYFISAIAFIKLNFIESFQPYLAEIWLIFLGVVASNASISKFISMKYKGGTHKGTAKSEDDS